MDLLTAIKALGHPTRLSIYDLLMEGVQCSCEISERLALTPSLISYHMSALEEAGLVQSERDGDDARWIYYSVNEAALAQLRQALDRFLDPTRIKPRVPNCGPKKCCS